MFDCNRLVLCVVVLLTGYCDGQFLRMRDFPARGAVAPPIPFPACRADNIDCLRRGLRTFFILMDAGHMGMKPIDPTIVNSVAVSMPEDQMSILLRRANVTGARWTKLTDRRNYFLAYRADNIDCLRRGLRTFFILMDAGHMGMKPIDPTIVNSVAVSMPEDQMSILLRRANVTGARWTKLTDRRFNLEGGKSGTEFFSDLHVSGELNMNLPDRGEPYVAQLTMDIQDVETNITYPWNGRKGIDNEDYIMIGPERIAVRNTRTPSYFLLSSSGDGSIMDQVLKARPSILDHLSNEITTALMHTIVDNFRLFASRVPVRYYYEYQ